MPVDLDLKEAELRLIADQGRRTAAAVTRMGQRLDSVEAIQSHQQQELGGMKEVVESNTGAMNRFTNALDRIDQRLDFFVDRLGAHEIEAEKEFRSLPRTAIAIWSLSLSLGASLLGWLALIFSPGLAQSIKDLALRIASHGGHP